VTGVITVIATDIRVFAHHGVLPQEKERGQDFLIDVEVGLEPSVTPGEDLLSSTVDYAEVVRLVHREATSRRYNLVETLAGKIAETIIAMEGARTVSVTVKKPEAPLPAEAGWVGARVDLDSSGEESEPGGAG
jgi:dihydroneopterin aldolase